MSVTKELRCTSGPHEPAAPGTSGPGSRGLVAVSAAPQTLIPRDLQHAPPTPSWRQLCGANHGLCWIPHTVKVVTTDMTQGCFQASMMSQSQGWPLRSPEIPRRMRAFHSATPPTPGQGWQAQGHTHLEGELKGVCWPRVGSREGHSSTGDGKRAAEPPTQPRQPAWASMLQEVTGQVSQDTVSGKVPGSRAAPGKSNTQWNLG